MSVKKHTGRRKKKAEPKVNLKEKMAEILELPKEIVLNMPKLTMLGNGDLIIENYKGIIEYEDARVRINTTTGIIKVTGDRLTIKEITSEDIMINGDIASLEFYK
ncbi:MAG: sporulation protein YqfC [Clostridia bacterium]|nr:sporulation protein YqfC [Clostridia bacterium]